MRHTLQQLIVDDVLPNHLPDIAWLQQYMEDGCPQGDPIMLSLGETWTKAPRKLTAALLDQPKLVHGYQLSMYGLPALRRTLRQYLIRTHVLPDEHTWEVGVTWTGTRSAMFDYGRYLLQEARGEGAPVVLATAPGWDYAGVFEPLGYRMRYLHLRPETGFQPAWADLAALMNADSRQENLAVLVINAQHNPTGVNWNPVTVRNAIRVAVRLGCGVLIDDAYYAIHDPAVEPTSALRILLEELASQPRSPTRRGWVAVRSLGKQFHCNGWALGAVTADPETLDALVNVYRVQHGYNYNGMLQAAMNVWLQDPGAEQFVQQQREDCQKKRTLVGGFLHEFLRYPRQACHLGECSSYVLFQVPPVYGQKPNGVKAYLRDCFFQTGVLFSDVWPLPRVANMPEGVNYVRMYLAPATAILMEALQRMYAAGLTFDMPHCRPEAALRPE